MPFMNNIYLLPNLPLFQEQAVPLCLAFPFAKHPFPPRPLPPLLTVKYDAAAVVLREY